MKPVLCIAASVLLVFLSGCEILGPESRQPFEVQVPEGFPPVPVPEYNLLSPAKIELGERLFFDPILSGDQTVSCGSCHEPELAFSDGRPRSIGIAGQEGIRNAPSLLNVAYQRVLFWDGGSLNLEAQVIAPLESEVEMHADLAQVLERLQSHDAYPGFFEEAFGEGPSIKTLTRAIAAYERTLVSSGSRYDAFAAGDSTALTDVERRGLALFQGKASCEACHSDFLFSNLAFENKGLTVTRADSGRARITLDPADYGRFKVPSLRNVAATAPYMHDGRFESLVAVLGHYNKGGDGIRGQSALIKPLNLTDAEMEAIIAFLHSLTDN